MRKWLSAAACIAALGASAHAAPRNPYQVELDIYGNGTYGHIGTYHRAFLGCFTCASNDPRSVWNSSSKYGWGNDAGIWSPTGEYRNKYSNISACNREARDPPVLYNRYWSFYYRISVDHRLGSICGPNGDPKACKIIYLMCGMS